MSSCRVFETTLPTRILFLQTFRRRRPDSCLLNNFSKTNHFLHDITHILSEKSFRNIFSFEIFENILLLQRFYSFATTSVRTSTRYFLKEPFSAPPLQRNFSPSFTSFSHSKISKMAVDNSPPSSVTDGEGGNFLKQIMEEDLKSGKHKSIVTRFPPEPNGFLHLGHAKSIFINFGLAKHFGGKCHLRFDDTNPMKEEVRYIESIKRDVKWLGGDWGDNLFYASDYFENLYNWAEDLINKGLAFVDDDTPDQIREKRGSVTEKGIESGFRNRSVEENLDLFRRMRAGEFEEGSRVLRAKIDMAHGNMNMRDPLLYRIIKKEHPKTGNKWVIYPMYDYAHGQSDSIEKITHSICTVEFELHRPLYDWFQEKLQILPTRQIEFSRLNVTYTVMSKRKLLALVNENFVEGWDDPRLPTLSAYRRRGVPPGALKLFCDKVGVTKNETTINMDLLDRCIREYLHNIAHRRFAVTNPIKVIITNLEKSEKLEARNHPSEESFGTREITFGKEMYIEKDDFQENPQAEFFRLAPGKEVRLKYAYWIKCNEVVKDSNGEIKELLCTYDEKTKNVSAGPDGRTVKGTIHWISAEDAVPATFRVYERLFTIPFPETEEEGKTWRDNLNPNSLKVLKGYVEADAATPSKFPQGSNIQFERCGFYTPDCGDLDEQLFGEKKELATTPQKDLLFNRTIDLQEGFSTSKEKIQTKEKDKQKDKEAREAAAEQRKKIKEDREARKQKREAEKA